MLKWKQNPMDAYDRQILGGQAVQIAACGMMIDMAKNNEFNGKELSELSVALEKGAQVERDAIRAKIDLYFHQKEKYLGTLDWVFDERQGTKCAEGECCGDPVLGDPVLGGCDGQEKA